MKKRLKNNARELGKNLFGKYSSDDPNLSENSEEIFRNKIKRRTHQKGGNHNNNALQQKQNK